MSRAKFWLLAIAVLYALGGFLLGISGSAAYESEVAFTGIVVFPLYVLTYLWMKADAQERSSASPPGAIPLVAVLLPIAVPYYLIATRHGWGKALAVLGLVGFVVLVVVFSVLASELGAWLIT